MAENKLAVFLKQIVFPILLIVVLTHFPIIIVGFQEISNPPNTTFKKFISDYFLTGGALITSLSMIITSIISYKSNPLLNNIEVIKSKSYLYHISLVIIGGIVLLGIINYTEILRTSSTELNSLKTISISSVAIFISICCISYTTFKTYYCDAAQEHLQKLYDEQEKLTKSKKALKGNYAND
ncbi:hypothetical protein [Lysinibacillus fusiformis]|uniref:hypothetical protein n=1 Tax=Lysinibacillus fusiformis TaxID=28031 RepID=UPI0021C213B0|nr:hypothetical protein [Lysinibacillus fusiformis]UXJ68182.1 hypothetical protein N5069_18910 [Lysinibacillus fusiformis]